MGSKGETLGVFSAHLGSCVQVERERGPEPAPGPRPLDGSGVGGSLPLRRLAGADAGALPGQPEVPARRPHPAHGAGCARGNSTSQFFANLYPDGLDHFCKGGAAREGIPALCGRLALFHDSADQLDEWRQRIARYLEGRRLRLHPRKTAILPTSDPAQFLGFVLLSGGVRRLPEDNVRRFRNRLRGIRDRYRHGTIEKEDVIRRVRSWVAHAEHANTWRLRQAIFRASRFGDAREPSTGERNGATLRTTGPGHPPSAFCAAVRGTTNHRTSAPRTGTGTPPATETTTTGSERPRVAMLSEWVPPLLPIAGERRRSRCMERDGLATVRAVSVLHALDCGVSRWVWVP